MLLHLNNNERDFIKVLLLSHNKATMTTILSNNNLHMYNIAEKLLEESDHFVYKKKTEKYLKQYQERIKEYTSKYAKNSKEVADLLRNTSDQRIWRQGLKDIEPLKQILEKEIYKYREKLVNKEIKLFIKLLLKGSDEDNNRKQETV